MAEANGISTPPCCLKVLTGLALASTYAFEKFNLSHCLYCGQVLSVIKIPGGELPWDTDVDFPLYSKAEFKMSPNFYNLI